VGFSHNISATSRAWVSNADDNVIVQYFRYKPHISSHTGYRLTACIRCIRYLRPHCAPTSKFLKRLHCVGFPTVVNTLRITTPIKCYRIYPGCYQPLKNHARGARVIIHYNLSDLSLGTARVVATRSLADWSCVDDLHRCVRQFQSNLNAVFKEVTVRLTCLYIGNYVKGDIDSVYRPIFMGEVWPTTRITELCSQLTAGSRPVNGDEHRALRSQLWEGAVDYGRLHLFCNAIRK